MPWRTSSSAWSRGSQQPTANFVTTSRAGQLIRVQMAPVLGAVREAPGRAASGPSSGYVLMLDNITRNLETESRRDALLQSLTEGSRASLGNIRAAVENLLDYPDMEAEQRDRFVGIIGDEVQGDGQRLDRTANEFSDALKSRWPLEDMLGEDFIAAARRRIEKKLGLPTKLDEVAEGVWVKVDSFSLLQGVTYLASRLHDEYDIRELRFRLAPAGRLVHLDLVWSGTVVGSQTVARLGNRPDAGGGGKQPAHPARGDRPPWRRDLVRAREGFPPRLHPHAAAFAAATPQEAAVEPAALRHAESRPEYYDFNLFRQTEESRALDDRLLTS
jgi:DNA polymerase-3 subunit epsilon